MSFARHKRHGAATRAAVKAWGLETQCQDPHAHSPALTGVRMPEGHDADNFPQGGAGEISTCRSAPASTRSRARRSASVISGHFNDLMLMGTLSGVEMGLDLAKVPHRSGGVQAAMEVLKGRECGVDAESRRRLMLIPDLLERTERARHERPGDHD